MTAQTEVTAKCMHPIPNGRSTSFWQPIPTGPSTFHWCDLPADPRSAPGSPRCTDHLTPDTTRKGTQ